MVLNALFIQMSFRDNCWVDMSLFATSIIRLYGKYSLFTVTERITFGYYIKKYFTFQFVKFDVFRTSSSTFCKRAD